MTIFINCNLKHVKTGCKLKSHHLKVHITFRRVFGVDVMDEPSKGALGATKTMSDYVRTKPVS